MPVTPSPDEAMVLRPSHWLHRFAVLTGLVAFLLVTLGGSVTSYDAGLTVPDWPNTFGHSMFTAPLDVWYTHFGTRLEHSHRLLGSLVGAMTGVLAGWILVTQRHRRWLVGVGLGLVVLVVVQGVMGGLRVTERSSVLAAVHGVTGQVFLAGLVVVAVATGRVWREADAGWGEGVKPPRPLNRVRAVAWPLVGLLLVQLMLGAAVRHSGSALAIPTFPDHLGHLIPPTTSAGIQQAFAELPPRYSKSGVGRPWQVWLHFAHRCGAVVVTLAVMAVLIAMARARVRRRDFWTPALVVTGLVLLQALLGVMTVMNRIDPRLATAHQACGAALLAAAVWLALRASVLAGGGTRGDAWASRFAGVSSADPACPRVRPGVAT